MKREISIGNETYQITSEDFDEEVDIDSLLRIDLSNLVGEIVTYPIIVNRFGIMVAAKEREIAGMKISIDVLDAKLRESLRAEHDSQHIKPPTVDQLNTYVSSHPNMLKKKLAYAKLIEERDILQTTMWCAKDKSEKLNKLSLSLQPDDVQNVQLQGKVNGLNVTKVKKRKGLIE